MGNGASAHLITEDFLRAGFRTRRIDGIAGHLGLYSSWEEMLLEYCIRTGPDGSQIYKST